ncbi:alpha/beta hydrolase [Sphingomonas sp. HDW15A]|uniref:alpha/beta hydrolase n=1 Tax=Sphingomonas sp. HDW15A TaxID=2714942 RepID=UPI00140A01B3|nr:alpha/beta hydrolase [Sphingomonas sp. HDW15A]QIK95096.1 alpha/beta hydrolase [Sphingomonas sp. HDW15A]
MMRKWVIGTVGFAALVFAAFALSPWPSILLVRTIFDRGAAEASQKLERHVPPNVSTTTHQYDPKRSNAHLDVHRPGKLESDAPTIVWIHGGGFVSGRRGDISNYAKILAGAGFTVVNVDYTIAPEAHYPEPIRQINAALAFLDRNASKLGVNAGRMVLAGDSAGAQIAAQTAAVVTNPAYARLVGIAPGLKPGQLAGTLLFCGVYDISGMGRGGGILGWFVQSAGWAYSGKRDWRDDPQFRTMSLAAHLTNYFPPAFVSAGNADPLGPQSVAMAQALKKAGVPTETLFFPASYAPPLGHEYQFDLDGAAGQLAFRRSVAWLRQLPR